MKKIKGISVSLFALFLVFSATSCDTPKKKPKCLAMETFDTQNNKVTT